MSPTNDDLKNRVLKVFKTLAPQVVIESVRSQATDTPRIDLYDVDFFTELARPHLLEIPEIKLRRTIEELDFEIEAVFLDHYRRALRIPSRPVQ